MKNNITIKITREGKSFDKKEISFDILSFIKDSDNIYQSLLSLINNFIGDNNLDGSFNNEIDPNGLVDIDIDDFMSQCMNDPRNYLIEE